MKETMEELNRRHEELVAKTRAAEIARYEEAFASPPALQGSEKQIAWASKIRYAFIALYKDRRRKYCGSEVLAHTDAVWWINNRYLWR